MAVRNRYPSDVMGPQYSKGLNKYEPFQLLGALHQTSLSNINGTLVGSIQRADLNGQAHSHFIKLLTTMLPVVYTIISNQNRSRVLMMMFALSYVSQLAQHVATYGQLVLYALVVIQQIEYILGTIQTTPGGKRILGKPKKRVTWSDGRSH